MDMTPNIFATTEEALRGVGERVRALRISKNVTQEQVAKKAGVSLRTVRELERHGKSSVETLIRVLRALDITDPISSLAPAPRISPMRLLHSTKVPQRARTARTTT